MLRNMSIRGLFLRIYKHQPLCKIQIHMNTLRGTWPKIISSMNRTKTLINTNCTGEQIYENKLKMRTLMRL